jgi:hypothetical protein
VDSGNVDLAHGREGAREDAFIVRVQLWRLLNKRVEDRVERVHRFGYVAQLLQHFGLGDHANLPKQLVAGAISKLDQ